MALSLEKRSTIFMLFILVSSTSKAMSRTLTEDVVTTAFQQWLSKYGRFYQDDHLERAKRFKIFKANMEHIESFNNEGNRTYKIGLNKFADLTAEEVSATYKGYKMPGTNTLSGNQSKLHDVQGYPAVLPDSIDWRQKGAVTPVKNQGQCGCCWAFSTVGGLEGLAANGVSLSAQQLIDCVADNSGCNGGWMNTAFDYVIKNQGIMLEDNYPYMAKGGKCKDKYMKSSTGIYGYVNVPNSEQDLKAAVAKQPVSVAISTCRNFYLYDGGVFQEDCGPKLDHAVVVVGYGKTMQGQKYWLIKNSWGRSWGENGYMRLQRGVGSGKGLCGITMAASYPVLQGN